MMFTAASLRLAGWYVAILMGLSLAFSVWVYIEASNELRISFEEGPVSVWIGTNYGLDPNAELQRVIEQQVANGQQRVIERLVLLNIGVFIVGGAASYWLARRTLRPIEAALEAQNRFTADASHELRTPLAAMKTEIEVTLRDPKVNKLDLTKLLRSNLEEIDRMGSLAHNLLALARTDAKPHLSAVRVAKVILAARRRLQPLAEAKKITVKYDDEDHKVMANFKQLETIIGILLDNAIKYSPEKTTVTVMAGRDDGHCLISVIDEGFGIDPQSLPHIFERFYRADSSRSQQRTAGHGLGLSIAMKLAEGLHATLSVRSQPGQGSVFTVRLALAQ